MGKTLEPEQVIFTLADGRELPARVRRSTRTTHVKLHVSFTFNLEIIAPPGVSLEAIKDMTPHFQPWLEKKCQEMCFRLNEPMLPEYIRIPLLNLDLEVATGPYGSAPEEMEKATLAVLLKKGPKRLAVIQTGNHLAIFANGRDDGFRVLGLHAFFRKLAGMHLPPYARNLADKGGYEKIDVTIRNQKTRWASCTRNSRRALPCININWRALLLPVPMLRHLFWHELAHLREMNHSPAFYAELAVHSPQWEMYEKALNNAWRNMGKWTFPVGA